MSNDELLLRLLESVEFGKVNKDAPYPPYMKGQEGAVAYLNSLVA